MRAIALNQDRCFATAALWLRIPAGKGPPRFFVSVALGETRR
jgi:hypothetical protein